MKKILTIFFLIISLSSCNESNDIATEKNILIEKKIEGESMEPLIENGSKVLFSDGFYGRSKKTVKNWDIVLYDFKWEDNPIIKFVVARSEDTVVLKNNTLFVNDSEVKNSAWESYNFWQAEQRIMKLYINEKSSIPQNSVFILWDNINDSRDSRKFWAVSMDDILWKITLK